LTFGDIDRDEREHLRLMFQMRHVFEHNGGVVDDEFCSTVPGTDHLIGRRYPLQQSDAETRLGILPRLGQQVLARVQALAATTTEP
jgi:hypothetical protein